MKKSLKKCIVCNERKDKGIFRFPKDSALTIMWLEALKLSLSDITEHSRVCSNHFNGEEVLELAGKKYLRPGALPSLYSTAGDLIPTTRSNIDNDHGAMKNTIACSCTTSTKHNLVSHMEGHLSRKNTYICYYCGFETKLKKRLIVHIEEHSQKTNNQNLQEPLSKHVGISRICKLYVCRHCMATFKSKRILDDHIVKKHPDFIETVTSKIHECSRCTYKTTLKNYLGQHILKHPEPSLTSKPFSCIHCNATYMGKSSLNYHIIKEHPDLVASVLAKIYECTKCAYKTPYQQDLSQHMSKHGIVSSYNLSTCMQCGATFKCRTSLDNHILKKHPNFIASVTSKIHECIKCFYKTPYKRYFDSHLLKHCNSAPNDDLLISCLHCEARLRSKRALEEHVVRKHPNFIASVNCKIHQCKACTFKTTVKSNFNAHISKHHIVP